jgi:ATP synthase subunit C
MALGGAGVGIGIVFGGLLRAYAMNPRVGGELFKYAVLGFAFVEACALNRNSFRVVNVIWVGVGVAFLIQLVEM